MHNRRSQPRLQQQPPRDREAQLQQQSGSSEFQPRAAARSQQMGGERRDSRPESPRQP